MDAEDPNAKLFFQPDFQIVGVGKKQVRVEIEHASVRTHARQNVHQGHARQAKAGSHGDLLSKGFESPCKHTFRPGVFQPYIGHLDIDLCQTHNAKLRSTGR